jgi:hypothetical protein
VSNSHGLSPHPTILHSCAPLTLPPVFNYFSWITRSALALGVEDERQQVVAEWGKHHRPWEFFAQFNCSLNVEAMLLLLFAVNNKGI